jgi:hypothetical protein
MKSILYGLCTTGLLALPAAADAATACKSGVPTMVRISALTPGGTRAAFDKATSDQIKWYRDHGITTNEVVEASVLDSKTGAVSPNEIMTLHYNAPSAAGTQPAPDAAYKAFVAEFRANSNITLEKLVCLPGPK